MACSMTGFGRGTASSEGLCITVEIRTVNHKHLNIQINGVRSYPELETWLRKALTASFSRGSIQTNVSVDWSGELSPTVVVNRGLVEGYRHAFDNLQAQLGEPPTTRLSILVEMPGVLTVDEPDIHHETLVQVLEVALQHARSSVDEFRRKEGIALAGEIESRLKILLQMNERILDLSARSVDSHRDRLKDRVEKLLKESDVTVEPGRLEQEIVILADKCDVSEEVARLASHLVQFRQLLTVDQPVGRRLDFLCQEIAREYNTINAKSQDTELTQLIVEMRAENEKIREQVQNLE